MQYLRYSLGLYKKEPKEANKLGITIKAHDAISDVLVMKLLLSKLIETAGNIYGKKDVMKVLARLTTKPVLIKTFKFGKYKDRMVADIAKKWMGENLELDEDLRYTLDYYIN